MKKYNGALDYEKMGANERAAYASWKNQRSRCMRESHPGYRWYGAKGIRVEYSSREFIAWWISEIKNVSIKGQVHCSRRNHEENYRFGNIKLESKSENSLEAVRRNNRGTRVIAAKEARSYRFDSINKMCAFFSWRQDHVCRTFKRKKYCAFEYHGYIIALQKKESS